jgi:hypothetical protein
VNKVQRGHREHLCLRVGWMDVALGIAFLKSGAKLRPDAITDQMRRSGSGAVGISISAILCGRKVIEIVW